jgi:hypothetical protein
LSWYLQFPYLISSTYKHSSADEPNITLWNELVELAQCKLVCQPDLKPWKEMALKGMTSAEAVSLLSVRVLVNILPQSNITETLVSEFMNYCFFIDNDRETLIIKSISEPILSHASGLTLSGNDIMDKCVDLDWKAI